MKLAILGTRGIPNHYGGFEQFAQYLSRGLVELGVEVWVYNSHDHFYSDNSWQGVNIIHCYDPEFAIGASGQFIYDLNCILDARKRKFDIILQLGYTTSTIWHWLMPKNSIVVTNMDGIEWKRSKYSKPLQKFIKYAEGLAVKSSDMLISDSTAIQAYLSKEYSSSSVFIPYGAEIFTNPNPSILKEWNVKPFEYFLVIARMQPDNHVEEIVKGILNSSTRFPLLIIGNTQNKHGKILSQKYKDERVRFLGSIFDIELLNQLRYHCHCYFHGHSAGGTNPSLLEAMAASAPICAHSNPFNKSVLENEAFYFSNHNDIFELVNSNAILISREKLIKANTNKIVEKYSWDSIIKNYFFSFKSLLKHQEVGIKAKN